VPGRQSTPLMMQRGLNKKTDQRLLRDKYNMHCTGSKIEQI
jgi:hypothetical protein